MFGEERGGIVAMPNAGGVIHRYDLAASVGSPKAFATGELNNLMPTCGRTPSISGRVFSYDSTPGAGISQSPMLM
jgi:hypothetical protein